MNLSIAALSLLFMSVTTAFAAPIDSSILQGVNCDIMTKDPASKVFYKTVKTIVLIEKPKESRSHDSANLNFTSNGQDLKLQFYFSPGGPMEPTSTISIEVSDFKGKSIVELTATPTSYWWTTLSVEQIGIRFNCKLTASLR